jgi:phenylpyruvate tautomerase PptA (4-oxalocrotonate tautomerase family)
MPLVHISLKQGKSRAHITAVSDGIHQALVDVFKAPPDDRFQLIHRLDDDSFIYDADYLGIHRTEDLVMIQIIAGNWRDAETKKRLYQAIADNLAENPGLRREDVIVALTGNAKEDWSFGNGLASYL